MKSTNKFIKIWTIALPMVVQGIVFELQSLTDKAFLGNLGTKYISALGAAQFPYNTTMESVLALSTGLVIFTAQFVGAKKEDRINHYVLSSVFYGSFISLALFLMWVLFAEPILQLLNVDAGIMSESVQYIKICSGSFLLLGIDIALQSMLQGLGNTKPIMVCGVMKVVLNIVISYILIFGVFGIPAMNIKGAAIGTLAANIISSLSIMFYCLIYKRKEYHLLNNLYMCLKFKFYKEVIKIGVPTALEYFLWNGSNLVLIAFLNSLNYKATAVYTLTFGIENVIFAIYNGVGKSAMTLIGQDIGAANYKSADSYMKIGILINTSLVIVSLLAFTFVGTGILGIFTFDKDLISLTIPYLIFTAVIMSPKSMNIIFGNGIRAYGNTKWMLYSQIFGSIFVISCSFVLVKVLNLGITAIYITLFADETLRALINGFYYKSKYSLNAKHPAKRQLEQIL